MCRIVGHIGSRATRPQLLRARARQHAGGPDSQSLVTGPGWALGANRLAITDPSGGHQPYTLGADLLVVFNGEIYNHEELRRRVLAWGYPIEDRCDGSILPALYHHYGEAFTEHLDGMYAIAVLDLRDAEPTLVLATDHAGIKPLYYSVNPTHGSLVFASELRALRALPDVDDSLWPGGLDAYLTTKALFGEQTMFSGIRAVPPSTTLVFSARRGLRTRHRSGGENATVRTVPGADLAEAAEQTRELITREVARLARADVPVCSVLSGGLDSSLVTAMLARNVASLHSFSVRYAGTWPGDETAFAHAVSEYTGTTHHTVTVDPAEFPELLAAALDAIGQPNADPIVVSTHALFRTVRETGFPVALTGDGADEVFLGYDRMVEAVGASSTGQGWRTAYLDSLAAIPRADRLALYTPEYRRYVLDSPSAAEGLLCPGDPFESFGPLEVGERLPAYHLRRVDHLAMASGVEARVPFCQREVQRLAGSLAPEHRLRGAEVKRALRQAAQGFVPDVVLDRAKQPFTLPIAAMLHAESPLLEYASDLLSPESLRHEGQLSPSVVGRLLTRHRAMPSAASAMAVWALTVYQAWRLNTTTIDRTEVAA